MRILLLFVIVLAAPFASAATVEKFLVDGKNVTGMNLADWITLPAAGCHLGSPRGGTRYTMGFSGFATEQDALIWLRPHLPNGWLLRP